MSGPYYVSKSGSNTNNGLSVGSAFLTIDHAASVCVGGETVYILPGSYGEGANFWAFNYTYPSLVTFAGYSGIASDVTITGVSSAEEVIFTNAGNVKFQDVTFGARSSGTLYTLRFNSGVINLLYFLRCVIYGITNPSQFNAVIRSIITTQAVIKNITFDACTIYVQGQDPMDGVYMLPNNSNDVFDSFSFINGTTVTATRHGILLNGCTNTNVAKCAITASPNNVAGGSSPGTALQLGVDGTTGNPASGTISDNLIISTYGHGAVIGAGVTSASATNNRVYGGSTVASGQGFVIKDCSGVVATDNTIYSGYLNGLYFKGCNNCTVTDNTVANYTYSRSYCLHMGWDNSSGAQAYDNVVENNRFITNVGSMVYWGSAIELQANNVCDYNTYELYGTGNWGSWENGGASVNIASFADLQAKQAAYLAGNDAHSISITPSPYPPVAISVSSSATGSFGVSSSATGAFNVGV